MKCQLTRPLEKGNIKDIDGTAVSGTEYSVQAYKIETTATKVTQMK